MAGDAERQKAMQQLLTACMRESLECFQPDTLHRAAMMTPPSILLVPRPANQNTVKHWTLTLLLLLFLFLYAPDPCGTLEVVCNWNPQPYLVSSCSLRERVEGNSTMLAQMKAAFRRATVMGKCPCTWIY